MMNKQHAKHMADAYCDGVCETGLAGLCPGDGCCEVYPHNVKHFMTADIGHIEEEKKIEKYEYATVYFENSSPDKKQLAGMGLEGWKMVGISSSGRGGCVMFFIRVLS